MNVEGYFNEILRRWFVRCQSIAPQHWRSPVKPPRWIFAFDLVTLSLPDVLNKPSRLSQEVLGLCPENVTNHIQGFIDHGWLLPLGATGSPKKLIVVY